MEIIGIVIAIMFGIPVFVMLVLSMFNKRLPVWACHRLGWHLRPEELGYDGCSATGICPRCLETVMQDSQGNWF